jgi:hypothetical protein
MIKNQLIYFFIGITSLIQAQVGINIANPDGSAALDIVSNNKGLLIPRVALTGTNDFTTIINPANSLLIYNTNETTGANAIKSGYYSWNTTEGIWQPIENEKKWKTTGNDNINSTTNFLGTTDNQDLVFKTNNTEKLRIQNNGKIGINSSMPNASSIVDINSTTAGLQIPRMTTTQRDAIPKLNEGMQIFNITESKLQGTVTDVPTTFVDLSGTSWGSIATIYAQSFKIINDGLLHSITFFATTNIAKNYNFTVYKNINASGPVIFSTSVFIGTTPSLPVEIIFNPAIPVLANEIYTFFPEVVKEAVINSYPDGGTSQNNSSVNSVFDIMFIAKMKTLKWMDLNENLNVVDFVNDNAWSQNGNLADSNDDKFIGTRDANDLVFKTSNIERMRINTNGFIGININNPNAPLQFENNLINKKLVLHDLGINNNHNFSGFGNDDYHLRYQTENTTTDHVFYAAASDTSSNELFRVKGNGRVGIGTDNPLGILDVEATDANALFIKSPNSQIALQESDNGNKTWKTEVNASDFGISESSQTLFKIKDNATASTLTLDNGVAQISKLSVNQGTTINKNQNGNLVVGAGVLGSKTKTVALTFPVAFSSDPNIVTTAVNDSNLTDKFSVSVTNLSTTGATLIIYRLDIPTPNATTQGWGQNLTVNWWAFE